MAERVVAIVGARLNSSRLPRKHMLPLSGEPLIAHIFHRLAAVPEIDEAVLATTADDYNRDLALWAAGAGVACYAHEGDVNDLMGRVDAVVRAYKADIILYVCGDSPLIEPSTLSGLLSAMKADPLSDIAAFAPGAVGAESIHVGFDVYRRAFWDRMIEAASLPFEREHVGAVWRHAGKVTPSGTALFADAPAFSSLKHRISVDTAQDYRFMRRVYNDWYAGHAGTEPVSLEWVMDRLLAEPELRAINAEVHQRGVTEVARQIVLCCEAGPDIGLGHLSRSTVAAFALQAALGAKVRLVIRGTPVEFDDLRLLPHDWVTSFSEAFELVEAADALTVDVKKLDDDAMALLAHARLRTLRVGIDANLDDAGVFDLMWMPSLYVPADRASALGDKLAFGPGCFLLRDSYGAAATHAEAGARKRIIILTGGADPLHFSRHLPGELLAALPEDVDIDWVQGPYAEAPALGAGEAWPARWTTLVAPTDLSERLPAYDAAICIYGVSFYECIRAGLPVAVFDPLGAAKAEEWALVGTMFPDFVARDHGEAIRKVAGWMVAGCPPVPADIRDSLKAAPANFAREIERRLSLREKGATDAA